MPGSRNAAITDLLLAIQKDPVRREELSERLYERAYPHLHVIADRLMGSERSDHTLQATALVHEAFLVLVDQTRTDWKGRAHFLGVAANIMRRLLVDHARRRGRDKRGGGLQRVTLDEQLPRRESDMLDLLVLNDALCRLAQHDVRVARVVEQRVFGGMSMDEIAEVLGVSRRTIQDDWRFARQWLARELGEREARGP